MIYTEKEKTTLRPAKSMDSLSSGPYTQEGICKLLHYNFYFFFSTISGLLQPYVFQTCEQNVRITYKERKYTSFI